MQGVDPVPLESVVKENTQDLEKSPASISAPTPSSLSIFKEEILSIVKELESRMNVKFSLYHEDMDTKMKLYDSQVQELSRKLSEINTSLTSDKQKLENIDDLLLFQRKCNDQLTSHELRINNNTKDLSNACYKYDKIFLDNLLLPGIIGDCCKFKNLREYLDYNSTQVSLLLNFKDKQNIDLKAYKDRLEVIIKQFSTQMDGFSKDAIKYTNKSFTECEENYKEMNKDIFARINEMRMENSKYVVQLKNQSNELAIEWDKIINIQAQIDKKLEESVKEMKSSHQSTVDSFGEVQTEFFQIKRAFNEISEFVKDVRFRRNLGLDVTRNELKNLSKKLKLDKKTMGDDETMKPSHNGDINEKDIESYVKKYINGELVFVQNKYKEKEADNANNANANANNEKDDDDVSLEGNDKPNEELIEGGDLDYEKKLGERTLIASRLEKKFKEGSNSECVLRDEPRRQTVSVSANVGNTLNNGNSNSGSNDSFKKECDKKITTNERKVIELEHYTKKKLEELAYQIKLFIPINFNPYIRYEKIQISAVDQPIGDPEINGRLRGETPIVISNQKTVTVNFMENNIVPRSTTNLGNECNFQITNNLPKFPNRKLIPKATRPFQGKTGLGNVTVEDKK